MCFCVIVGIIIKIDDNGPVIYRSRRLGKDYKEFDMYKFRSMIVNAPDIRNADGRTYNSSDDFRMTKVGRVIRKTSIDEIPQIINVLKGEMSLVGPRPSPTGNVHLYSEDYKKKFQVKPGITGYSQAYLRNAATIEEECQKNIEYIKGISFALDMKIILKTARTVLLREGVFDSTHTTPPDRG